LSCLRSAGTTSISKPPAARPRSFTGDIVGTPTNRERRRLDLTNDPAADESPAVSPDGREIAYVSTRDGYEDVFVMNADGSDARRGRSRRLFPHSTATPGGALTSGRFV
jgi:hypothetical protein